VDLPYSRADMVALMHGLEIILLGALAAIWWRFPFIQGAGAGGGRNQKQFVHTRLMIRAATNLSAGIGGLTID
jgi:hypothetical protein